MPRRGNAVSSDHRNNRNMRPSARLFPCTGGIDMANDHTPTDPQRPILDDQDIRGATRRDNELQADPELQEGRASGGRMLAYGVAAAVLLGVVFYGLNNSGSMNPNDAKTASPLRQPTISRIPIPNLRSRRAFAM
jgi:hypothetical protein